MKHFPFLLVASLAVACTSSKGDSASDDTDDDSSQPSSEPSGEPSSEPSAEPGYEPTLFILSSYFAGEADIVPGTSYEGYESYDLNDGAYGVGEYNCQLVWDASGVSAANPASCANCEFSFDLSLTPRSDADYIVNDGTCDDTFTAISFQYAYSSDYEGYGASVLYDGSLWSYDGNVQGTTTHAVSFDGSKFSYGIGYVDYYYYY